MTQLNSDWIPDDPDQLPPARRRRARRLLTPMDADERASFLDDLAHRGSPSFDFYLFSAISASILSIALLLDEPSLILLGVLLAPLMAPMFGLSLAIVSGSTKFFVRNLFGFSIGSTMVFLIGIGMGKLCQFLSFDDPMAQLSQALYHAQLSPLNIFVLILAAGWTSAAMLKNEHSARIPSLALAFELFLPLVAAGIGLGIGNAWLWPGGFVVFVIHLSLAILIGATLLGLLGFRPLTLFGYSVGGAIALLTIVLVIGFGSAGAMFTSRVGLPTLIPSATLTASITPTKTTTPIPATSTITPSSTPVPTSTKTLTPVPSPTPIYAMITVLDSSGAYLRIEPGGEIIKSYLNGTIVQLLPESEMIDGVIWILVRAPDGIQGWMVQSLLLTPIPTQSG